MQTQYRLQGASSWLDTANNQFVVPAADNDGSHTYEYRALDNAGNVTQGSCTINIDTTPPVTTATNLASDATSGWVNSDQTVTLSADDGSGSGVKEITYTVDGGAAQTYSAPFTVSGAGSHTVTYFATDNAGNVEATQTGYVNIATEAPTTTATGLAPDATSGWVKSDQTVTLTAMGGTGTATITYTVDGGDPQTYSEPFTVSGDGSHEVTYYATDAIGNVEQPAKIGYVNIDTTPPMVSSDADDQWHAGPVVINLTPSDAGPSGVTGTSGVAHTYYRVNSGDWQEGTAATVGARRKGSPDGYNTLSYYAVDAAGNVGEVQTCMVKIDTTPPFTWTDAPLALSADKMAFVPVPQTGDVTVNLYALDSLSGVNSSFWRLDGGDWQQGTTLVVPGTEPGIHSIEYFSVDNLGNVEVIRSVFVVIQ